MTWWYSGSCEQAVQHVWSCSQVFSCFTWKPTISGDHINTVSATLYFRRDQGCSPRSDDGRAVNLPISPPGSWRILNVIKFTFISWSSEEKEKEKCATDFAPMHENCARIRICSPVQQQCYTVERTTYYSFEKQSFFSKYKVSVWRVPKPCK